MGLQILDGKGRGYLVEVDSDNRVHTKTVSQTKEQVICEETGKAWTIPFETLNPTAADDFIVYVKNTGNENLELTSIRVSVDTAATQLEVHAVTGTAAGGSTITPVSRKVGSGASPTATIESGADITGLSSTGVLAFMQLPVVATEYSLHLSSHIVIPKGAAIAISLETGTANLTGYLSIAEEGVD